MSEGRAQAPNPSAVSVDLNVACVTCGYLLHGLPQNGQCPECGAAVRLSLRGCGLAASGPRYLARVERGLWLVLMGIPLLALAAAIGVLLHTAQDVQLLPPMLPGVLTALFVCSAVVLNIAGYARATTPDPRFRDRERGVWPRRATVASAAACGGCVLGWLMVTLAGLWAEVELVLGVSRLVGLLLVAAAIGVHNAVMMSYVVMLGLRVPDIHLARTAAAARWLLPIMAIFPCGGVFLAIIMHWCVVFRLRRAVTRARSVRIAATEPSAAR